MNRRGFLGTILLVSVAPAICKAEWLMPVKSIIIPDIPETTINLSNGLHIGQTYTFSSYVKSNMTNGKWERITKTFTYDGTNGSGTIKLGDGAIETCYTQIEYNPNKSSDWYSRTPVGDMSMFDQVKVQGDIILKPGEGKIFDESIYRQRIATYG